MFYPHRVILFTEVCIVKQQIYENVIEVSFPKISTLEVFRIALKPAIILKQYYMCYREKKKKVDNDSGIEFFFRKSKSPQKHTIGNVIFEGISILPVRDDLTSLTDVVTGITLTMKTLSTLVGIPS